MITKFEKYCMELIPEDYRDKNWIFEHIKGMIEDGVSTDNLECISDCGAKSEFITTIFTSQEYKDYIDQKFTKDENLNYEMWLDDAIDGIQYLHIYKHNL